MLCGSQGITFDEEGYLPYHKGLISYHRLIRINLSIDMAFGNTSPPQRPLPYRKIRIHQTVWKKKYIPEIHHLTMDHNILPRLRDMEQLQNEKPSSQIIRQYKEIDRLTIKERDKVNYSIRRLHMSQVHPHPEQSNFLNSEYDWPHSSSTRTKENTVSNKK